MSDRIFKNWKTTSIGLLIIAASIGAVFANKATLTEAGAFITVGCGLFFMKDSVSQK